MKLFPLKKLNAMMLSTCSGVLSLGLVSCSDVLTSLDQIDNPYRYKAIFRVKDKQIPVNFILQPEQLNAYGLRLRIIDGPILNQLEHPRITHDTLYVPLDLHQTRSLKALMTTEHIKGELLTADADKQVLITPFTAYRSNKPRFDLPESYTDISATGTWTIQTALVDSTAYYVPLLSTTEKIYLYQTAASLIGSHTRDLGYDGVMTSDGFVLSSFTKARPILVEATYTDQNTITGSITTDSETYSFTGKRNSQLKKASDTSKSVFNLLRGLFGAYQEHK
ncbi:hypothetical protein [Myroides pelagicus]|uniref:DUF1735 domain-containing protein n=1 Tax=Myroides pelagicus TaxID=270914 RepID=A0A7K1GLS7_9FLAO|nr:hypothetical protein [Myroides pelagicus]MTH29748.1 hypothetical protein [Myroides pelagicus]